MLDWKMVCMVACSTINLALTVRLNGGVCRVAGEEGERALRRVQTSAQTNRNSHGTPSCATIVPEPHVVIVIIYGLKTEPVIVITRISSSMVGVSFIPYCTILFELDGYSALSNPGSLTSQQTVTAAP